MTAPEVKGWCPGAYHPMMSGDGLVVRVRPYAARLTLEQASGLCDLAISHGNGFLDLTNRANLQIRAVSEADYPRLLASLTSLGLVDQASDIEGRRNILVAPLWSPDDITSRLHAALVAALPDLPDLPAKFGFAIDTGERPVLQGASADIRIERSEDALIVRADGCQMGRAATEDNAIALVRELAEPFASRRKADQRRMAISRSHRLGYV